jgi:inner membrane protein
VLDTLTNGGVAIPLYWPFSEQRFFSPWRPVEVSPVSFSRFFTQRGADVLLNEVKTIWLPLMAAALAIFALRHSRKNQ